MDLKVELLRKMTKCCMIMLPQRKLNGKLAMTANGWQRRVKRASWCVARYEMQGSTVCTDIDGHYQPQSRKVPFRAQTLTF